MTMNASPLNINKAPIGSKMLSHLNMEPTMNPEMNQTPNASAMPLYNLNLTATVDRLAFGMTITS